jgi:hypothetical protein
MEKPSIFAKIEADDLDFPEDPTAGIIVDNEKHDYEYEMELDLVKSTRDNFMVWKDYDY